MSSKHKFLTFVIPSILAFALSGVYTIVDGFFVGNSLGDMGLASINLGFPVSALIQAVGTGIGLAGAIRFTIFKGQKKDDTAVTCFTATILLLALVSILLTGVILAVLSPLIHLLGAEGKLYTLTFSYVQIIGLGSVFQVFATGLVPFIRNLGGSAFAMFSMIAGFLTNIGLDYLFVWVYHQGMAGAAWATIIGQGVTMLAAVLYLIKKKIGFSLPSREQISVLFAAILKISVAPFGLTFSPQITTIFMNRFLMIYGGDQAVAVYGCIAYITAIIYLLLQGVGDGSQPLISRYFSEGNLAVMKQTRKYAYFTSAGISLICMAAFFVMRDKIGLLFGASQETNHSVANYLPLFLAALIFLSYIRITTAFFYATEKSFFSYLLVYAEPVSILILLLILPQIPLLGILGVWLAVPLAQCITWFFALMMKHKVDKQTYIE